MADNIALPDPNAHVQALIRATPDELLERSGTYGTETTLSCGWRSSRNGPWLVLHALNRHPRRL